MAIAMLLPTGIFGQIQNQPDDFQWPMPAKNYAATRYSTLDQINTGTVKNLKLAWSFSTGLTRGHEAAPLAVNNTMYVVTPWPNLLYALDLTKPGAPAKWTYDPHTSTASQGVACCDVVNRGIPLKRGSEVVGAVGVSGGLGKQDQSVAEAGAAAFEAGAAAF